MTKTYKLYCLNSVGVSKANVDGLIVIKTILSAYTNNLASFFVIRKFIQNWLNRKVYCIYALLADGKLIHVSHVFGKSWRYSFMNKNDILIGMCWTNPDFRGQGIYPSVIKRIASDYRERRIWIYCDERNISSVRGIEKAGFNFVSYLKCFVKPGGRHFYILCEQKTFSG